MFSSAALAEVEIEPVPGQPTFQVDYAKATDFSGLTWMGGNGYYAVSNRKKAMFPVRIAVDHATGRITEAAIMNAIPVKTDYNDFEGIAWVPEKQRVYISSESAHGIVGFDREGDARFAVNVPAIFQQARRNKSLESLTYGADALWTANEDTLEVDGPTSSAAKGALIRLQKFDDRFRPAAQYAYRTETSLLRVKGSGTGVCDLCALPNGDLLVLERVVEAGLMVKIFAVNFSGAADTSAVPSFEATAVKPVEKKLLLSRHTLAMNFEGMALGPELEGGWRSLLLISDSGGETKHFLMPLRLRMTSEKK